MPRSAPLTHSAGMAVLGYRAIPPAAFDRHGRLVWPSGMAVPPDWSRIVGRVAAEPAWSDLFGILGGLVAPGTAWTCWRVGLGFRNGTLDLVVTRARHSTAQLSRNWSDNLWTSVLSRLRAYAGRRYVLPATLVDAMSDTSDRVKASPYWTQYAELDKDDPRKVGRLRDQVRVIGAVDLLVSLARLVASATTQGKVRSTVLWFDPARPSIATAQLGSWTPLHSTYDAWANRAVHYWWNSGCESATRPGTYTSYPFVHSSAVQLRGLGVTDVVHTPWELASAFYPLGSWPAPVATAMEPGSSFTSFDPPAGLNALDGDGDPTGSAEPAVDRETEAAPAD